MEQKCPVCQSNAATKELGPLNTKIEVLCPTCGHYIITEDVERQLDEYRNIIAPWLFYQAEYHNSECTSFFLIYDGEIDGTDPKYISIEQIQNWYPRTFIEKADQFIMWLAKAGEAVGDIIRLTGKSAISACFGKYKDPKPDGSLVGINPSQYQIFVNRLIELGYLSSDSNYVHVALSAKGWIRVDELRKHNINNRDVFIAMSFDPKNDETKKALKEGIISAGYNYRIMSEEIHGKQIIPMMFRLIRESQLLVMDISDPNYGAYYEAGYALGLGKEVIITCNESVKNLELNEDEKKYEKYLKPHFDIAQKQILFWKDYADLTEQLSEWIKAIAG